MEKRLEKKSKEHQVEDKLLELRLPRREYREIKRSLENLDHISSFKQRKNGSLVLEISPGVKREEALQAATILLPVIQLYPLNRPLVVSIFGEGTLMVARGFAPPAPRRKRWWSLTEEAVNAFQEWLREDLAEMLSPGYTVRTRHSLVEVLRTLPR